MPAGVPLRSARISSCRARCVSRRMDSLTAFRFPGLRCSLPLICGQVRIAIFPEKLTADGEQPSGDGVARTIAPSTGMQGVWIGAPAEAGSALDRDALRVRLGRRTQKRIAGRLEEAGCGGSRIDGSDSQRYPIPSNCCRMISSPGYARPIAGRRGSLQAEKTQAREEGSADRTGTKS